MQKRKIMNEVSLTDGPIFKRLIWFSLPMILGNLLQQAYNLTDTLIVGRYIGSDALGAVGSVYTLMTFLTSVIIGLCMGSGAFFSADFGAENVKLLREDISLSFRFISLVAIVINIAIYPAMNVILALLKTPSELMKMTRDYVTIVFAGIIFIFLYNFFAFLLRAMGNSAVPLIFLAISTAVNIILDIWFVTSLNMGVKGAALATVIAQAVSGIGISIFSIIKLPVLRNKREISTSGRLKTIIYGDAATSVQQSVMNFGILMIQGLVNSFGTTVMASFAAAVKIDTIAYMPAQEFGNAYSLFVSQNYGSEKENRIKSGTKISFIASAIFCLIASLIICIFPQNLMSLFIDGDGTEIIAEGVRYLRTEGAMYICIGFLFLWYGYFRGICKPRISLILTIISLGTRVLLSYTLAPNTSLGVMAIWLSIPIGWILADITGLIIYKNCKLKF
jgi:putative MATE family efflux protein